MSRQVLFSRTIDPPIRSSTVSGAPFKWRREWDYLIRSAHEISSLAAARFESTPFEPCTVNQNTPDPLRRVRGVLMAEGVGLSHSLRSRDLFARGGSLRVDSVRTLHRKSKHPGPASPGPGCFDGGGSGIRTHGRLPYTRFRIERLKPDSAIPPFHSGRLRPPD